MLLTIFRKLTFLCVLVIAATAMSISGCGTTTAKQEGIQIDPTLHTVSKSDYVKGGREIELPQNYSQKNYKRLVVSAWFFPNKDANNYADVNSETISSMMETELSKLKRFTIVSRHLGQKGKMSEKNFQDQGTTNSRNKMRFGKGMNADYSLSAGVSTVKEEYDRGAKNEWIYIVRVDYQLVDNETDEIIEADMAEGRTKRTVMRLPSGKIIGGFSKEEEQDAMAQASINALKIIGNKIGNKLPIGGQVVSMRGNRIKIDKGHNEGFMGKQTVTLYEAEFNIPLAVAEVHPGDHSTGGKIFAWSNDPDAQEIIQNIKNVPNFIKDNEIFAVSNGMPLPPEWDKNYKD